MTTAAASTLQNTDVRLRQQYRTLRMLLKRNSTALRLLSDLESDLDFFEPFDRRIRATLRLLWEEALLMAEELNYLTGDRHRALYGALQTIEDEIERIYETAPKGGGRPLGLRLQDALTEDELLVGGKAAGLARLARRHPDHVPPGFIITTEAYSRFIDANDLQEQILPLLNDIDAVSDRDLLTARTTAIRDLIRDAETPPEIRSKLDELAAELDDRATSWAVRSSARCEDDHHSFAGQFDTLLEVKTDDLERAYKAVLAGRFTERAVLYRGYCGFRDVETPMAVLFMPMIDAKFAGVLYSANPQAPGSERMVATFVEGLSDRLLQGKVSGETVALSRAEQPHLLDDETESLSPLGREVQGELELLGRIAYAMAEELGHEVDIEWALDQQDQLWLLQGRRLRVLEPTKRRRRRGRSSKPFVEGGVTITPGRAAGPIEWLPSKCLPSTVLLQTVPVAVTEGVTPEITAILPEIAALLVRDGDPAGHAATLLREFAVPTIFQLGSAVSRLEQGGFVSVDASRRRVYHGRRWEGVRDRVLAKSASARSQMTPGPLSELVVSLNLTDPRASSFKASACRSIHDVVRYVHEQSIRSMFDFGDRQNRFWSRKARKLDTPLPYKLSLIEMDRPAPTRGKVRPEEIVSVPFQAFWRGVSEMDVAPPQRALKEMDWLPPEFVESVMGGADGPRRKGSPNYAVVAADYMNLNARMTYHYAMIDAVISEGVERNHVHFRVRGGGTDEARRSRRARFLELTLRQMRFVTDRRGDLITAWLRGYPAAESEEALTTLGRLMTCARQLDHLMVNDKAPRLWAAEFLAGNYDTFRYIR